MKKILIGSAIVIVLGIVAFFAFRKKEERIKFQNRKKSARVT